SIDGKVLQIDTGKRYEAGQPVTVHVWFPDEASAKEYTDLLEVVVEGRVAGASIFGPHIKEIKIVSFKKDQVEIDRKTKVFKVAEVTKECDVDEAAATKKYGRYEFLAFEGTVKDIRTDAKGDLTVRLEGHDKSHSMDCFGFKDGEAVQKKIKV